MVVMIPVVFSAKATEKCNKNTKICRLLAIILLISIYCKINCNSHKANCSMARARVVACRSLDHFSPMDPGIKD